MSQTVYISERQRYNSATGLNLNILNIRMKKRISYSKNGKLPSWFCLFKCFGYASRFIFADLASSLGTWHPQNVNEIFKMLITNHSKKWEIVLVISWKCWQDLKFKIGVALMSKYAQKCCLLLYLFKVICMSERQFYSV